MGNSREIPPTLGTILIFIGLTGIALLMPEAKKISHLLGPPLITALGIYVLVTGLRDLIRAESPIAPVKRLVIVLSESLMAVGVLTVLLLWFRWEFQLAQLIDRWPIAVTGAGIGLIGLVLHYLIRRRTGSPNWPPQ